VLDAVAGDNYRVVIAFAPHLDVVARDVEIPDIGTVPYSIDIRELEIFRPQSSKPISMQIRNMLIKN
jgi:hypothetical protein